MALLSKPEDESEPSWAGALAIAEVIALLRENLPYLKQFLPLLQYLKAFAK